MTRFAAVAMLLLAGGLAGCIDMPGRPSESQPPVAAAGQPESEKVVRLEDALASVKADRDRLVKELEAARKTPGAAKAFTYDVTRVDFGFLTAAVNFDNAGKIADKKYDNGIAAYVSLYDQYDSSLKAAGDFRLDLLDLTREKNFLIATWNFDAQAAAKYWQNFPGCYQFKLPLPSDLTSRKVLIKVSFRQPGRAELIATKELTISRP